MSSVLPAMQDSGSIGRLQNSLPLYAACCVVCPVTLVQ
jgi:hypothetical protein